MVTIILSFVFGLILGWLCKYFSEKIINNKKELITTENKKKFYKQITVYTGCKTFIYNDCEIKLSFDNTYLITGKDESYTVKVGNKYNIITYSDFYFE